jgi:hypothetical protein
MSYGGGGGKYLIINELARLFSPVPALEDNVLFCINFITFTLCFYRICKDTIFFGIFTNLLLIKKIVSLHFL